MTVTLSSRSYGRPPDVGPVQAIDFDPPAVERIVLSNGAVLYVLEDHELPIFDLSLRFKLSPGDIPEKQPESLTFLGNLWRAGGTKKRPPEKLSDELEQMAASVETGTSYETATVSVSCLSKDMDRALDLWADVLFNPRFDPDQLAISKGRVLENLRRKNDTPGDIARRAFRDVTYGRTHLYARNASPETVNRVSRAVLVDLHKLILAPETAVIAAAGDFKKDDLVAALERRFRDWKKSGRIPPPYDYSIKAAPEGQVFLVKKDFSQSRITMGGIGITRHSPEQYAMELANYILGGGGASRLFGEIRSRLGLAYMVGSFYTEGPGPGMVGVACQTKAESTVDAVRALKRELDRFSAGPVRAEEISLAKDAIINSFIFRYSSPYQIASAQAQLELEGYAPDFLERYPDRLKAVTAAQIQEIARTYFSSERYKTMVVGDESKFGAPLKSMGEVTEIPLSDVD